MGGIELLQLHRQQDLDRREEAEEDPEVRHTQRSRPTPRDASLRLGQRTAAVRHPAWITGGTHLSRWRVIGSAAERCHRSSMSDPLSEDE
ncbi:hypothetical protein GCM10010442_44270 [Kitasatospora kifunensis]